MQQQTTLKEIELTPNDKITIAWQWETPLDKSGFEYDYRKTKLAKTIITIHQYGVGSYVINFPTLVMLNLLHQSVLDAYMSPIKPSNESDGI